MVNFRGTVSDRGRIAYPDVVTYKLIAGPDKGEVVWCPPNVHTHPDPASAEPPPLSSAAAAKERASWNGQPRASFSYVEIIHDSVAYLLLKAEGLLQHKSHTGIDYQMVDNRRAPGA